MHADGVARTLIACRELTKQFGDTLAVDRVRFELERGAIGALIGPNGAGKSTIVKMLTGLLLPTSGAATVAGLVVDEEPQKVKQIVGVLPEGLGLFDSLTVEEHLSLTGPVYGIGRRETRRRAEDLLRVLGLAEARRTFAEECSHGMRKKTALAIALLPNPKVLFLDEPFEGIDPVTTKTIGELLRSVARRGVTVFLTSHILSIVEQIATRVLMIRDGRIVLDEATDDLPRTVEEHYFDLVEAPLVEELEWLGWDQS